MPPIRTLHVPMSQEDYERLETAKGDLTWHEFVMTLADKED